MIHIIQELLKAIEQGNKIFQKFEKLGISEIRLLRKTKSVYSPKKRQNIDTGIK